MNCLRSVFIVTAIALVSSASVSAEEPAWLRSDTFDPQLSFETPCATQELEVRESGGKEFGSREAEARCTKDGVAYDVQVFELLTPTKSKPFYDEVSSDVANDRTADGKPNFLTVNGHRAVFTYGHAEGLLGQKGLVEVSSSKVALVMAGGIPDAGVDLETQHKSIDRFFNSLQVRG